MAKEHSEQIRQLAYEIWEREGRPEGKEREHWEQAERELREQLKGNGDNSHDVSAATEMKTPRRPDAAPAAARKPRRTTTAKTKRPPEK